jgi:hypothetical protein
MAASAARPASLPPDTATLAVTLFLQLAVGVGGGSVGHALIAASLRRKFRDRVLGPPATEEDAALRRTEPFDAALLAGTAALVTGAACWWAVAEALV